MVLGCGPPQTTTVSPLAPNHPTMNSSEYDDDNYSDHHNDENEEYANEDENEHGYDENDDSGAYDENGDSGAYDENEDDEDENEENDNENDESGAYDENEMENDDENDESGAYDDDEENPDEEVDEDMTRVQHNLSQYEEDNGEEGDDAAEEYDEEYEQQRQQYENYERYEEEPQDEGSMNRSAQDEEYGEEDDDEYEHRPQPHDDEEADFEENNEETEDQQQSEEELEQKFEKVSLHSSETKPQTKEPTPEEKKERLTQDHATKTISHTLTSSVYEGPVKNLRMEGDKARYHFPNGDYYEGGFLNGTFHGDGIIFFKGGAQMKGVWKNGQMIESRFFFDDDLEWKDEKWDYCLEEYSDRRLWVEKVTHETNNQKEIHEKHDSFGLSIKEGIKPAIPFLNQVKHLQDMGIVKQIPKGTYDTGDGYFVPEEDVVRDYETHQVVRTVVGADERREILTHYRIGR